MSMQEISWYADACRLGRDGKAAEAVAALREGLEKGAWYNPGALAAEPDLAAARREIGPIVQQCEERRQMAAAEARPQCLVLSPSSALWDQQTLFLIHRRGDSARRFAEPWRPLVDEGWTLVVPQSSQPWDSTGWCWDDADQARREVRTHLEECRTRRGLDPSRMVMAGAAQGAPLAAELANEAGMAWLCVAPRFPRGYDVTSLAAVPRHTRGAFLLAENDPENTRTRLVIDSLQAAGASIQTRTMPGVAHEMPSDFAAHASELLRTLELV
jgi:predicted esterase